jgi:tetratricopeptide (TPR) repeat protein
MGHPLLWLARGRLRVAAVNLRLRYFVRFWWIGLMICAVGARGLAQEASSAQGVPVAQQAPAGPSAEVLKAEAAMQTGDWKTAEPVLDSWLAAHGEDERALFDAAYIADAQGRDADAAGLYRKALGVNPKSFEAEVSLGLLLARTGKAAEARPALWAATTMEPSADGAFELKAAKARAWRALAEIDAHGVEGEAGIKAGQEMKPDLAQASIDLLEALKLSPETEGDTLLAASLAETSGDLPGAEAAYRKVLKSDADSGAAASGLAHVLIAEKKYPEAEELLTGSLKKQPENAAMTAQLAAVYVAEDKTDAVPLLEGWHTKHPKDEVIARMLAGVEADAGEYAKSDALYVSLLAASPKDGELLTGHGQNLIQLRQYAEAVKVFQAATDVDETNGDAWNGLAFAAFQTHQPQITIHALTVRSKYLPDSAIIYFLWATAYDTLHDKKQAVAYYRRFLESASGKLPDQEWQARQRVALLEKTP